MDSYRAASPSGLDILTSGAEFVMFTPSPCPQPRKSRVVVDVI